MASLTYESRIVRKVRREKVRSKQGRKRQQCMHTAHQPGKNQDEWGKKEGRVKGEESKCRAPSVWFRA